MYYQNQWEVDAIWYEFFGSLLKWYSDNFYLRNDLRIHHACKDRNRHRQTERNRHAAKNASLVKRAALTERLRKTYINIRETEI